MSAYSHCHHCGAPYGDLEGWPRPCPGCGQITYSNPAPVGVAVVLNAGRLLVIERADGGWALPGGYIESGESWQQGVCRELAEELSVAVEPVELELFDLVSSERGSLLAFGIVRVDRDLAPVPDGHEVLDWMEIDDVGCVEWAFPLHEAAADRALRS